MVFFPALAVSDRTLFLFLFKHKICCLKIERHDFSVKFKTEGNRKKKRFTVSKLQCFPALWEVEARVFEGQSYPGLHSEFKVTVSYRRPCIRKKNK